MDARFLSSAGLQFATLIERAQLLPVHPPLCTPFCSSPSFRVWNLSFLPSVLTFLGSWAPNESCRIMWNHGRSCKIMPLKMPESAWFCLKMPENAWSCSLRMAESAWNGCPESPWTKKHKLVSNDSLAMVFRNGDCFRSCPGKPNQKKGQNEKLMNFAHFCEFWCFSLGKRARFTLNFCSGMPLRKVHELTFFWFGLPGTLLIAGEVLWTLIVPLNPKGNACRLTLSSMQNLLWACLLSHQLSETLHRYISDRAHEDYLFCC